MSSGALVRLATEAVPRRGAEGLRRKNEEEYADAACCFARAISSVDASGHAILFR